MKGSFLGVISKLKLNRLPQEEIKLTGVKMESAVTKMVNLPTQDVQLSQIKELPDSLRQHSKEDPAIIELAKNISEIGLLNNFSCVPRINEDTGKQEYIIADGASRRTALELLNDQGILKSDIITIGLLPEDTTDDEIYAMQIAGNALVQETKTPQFITKMYSIKYNNDAIDTDEKLAAFLGMSVKKVKDLFKTAKLPNCMREALSAGDISMGAALALSTQRSDITTENENEVLEFAKANSVKDLTEFLLEDIALRQKSKSDAKRGVKTQFIPTPKLVKAVDLDSLYSTLTADEAATEYEKGQQDLIKKIYSMDPETLEAKKVEWNAKYGEKIEKQLAKEQEKKQKAIDFLEASGMVVTENDEVTVED